MVLLGRRSVLLTRRIRLLLLLLLLLLLGMRRVRLLLLLLLLVVRHPRRRGRLLLRGMLSWRRRGRRLAERGVVVGVVVALLRQQRSRLHSGIDADGVTNCPLESAWKGRENLGLIGRSHENHIRSDQIRSDQEASQTPLLALTTTR